MQCSYERIIHHYTSKAREEQRAGDYGAPATTETPRKPFDRVVMDYSLIRALHREKLTEITYFFKITAMITHPKKLMF